jgi:hypothetical protein
MTCPLDPVENRLFFAHLFAKLMIKNLHVAQCLYYYPAHLALIGLLARLSSAS